METLIQTDNLIRRKVKRIPLFEDEPQTLAELFISSAEKHQLSGALNYKADNQWKAISSAQVVSRAENIALGLYSLNIKRTDRVAILAANSPDWTITDAGCQFAGVIDVPIYTTLSLDSIRYIINDSGTKVFFLEDKATFNRLQSIFPDCPSLEKIVLFKSEEEKSEEYISLAHLEKLGETLKGEQPSLINDLIKSSQPSDIATLIYTSGTTGEPKGVMLTHENIISNLIDAGEKYSFTEADKPLSVLPLSHVFERTGMYLYIFNGMSVYYAESIEKIADNLKEVRPTIFVGVPRIFEKVYARAREKAAGAGQFKEKIFDWAMKVGKEFAEKSERQETIPLLLSVKHAIADKLIFSKLREFFGGSLRFCITGGAALSDDIFYIFNGAGVKIMQGYGLTETSPVITSNNPFFVRAGTVGKPLRNIEVRLAKDGEIEVSGPNIMLGYYNKPEATEDTFTEDGWFKTGDIGEIDKDGFLKITDRKKELFKTSGGKYIAPSPIEQLIKASRYVNQVVLIGNNRKFPSALIVPNFEPLEVFAKQAGVSFKEQGELCENQTIIAKIQSEIDSLTSHLGRFEKVKRIVLLEKELTVETGELTPTLKVKRRIVDEKFKELIDKIYNEAG